MVQSGQQPWYDDGQFYVCEVHNMGFYHQDELFDHLNHQHSGWCSSCDREFFTPHARLSHYANSPQHAWCTFCRQDFNDIQSLHNHQRNHHAPCEGCGRVFDQEIGKHEHARQSHSDCYCVECRRMFGNRNNLNNHLNSKLHQPAIHDCPCPGCQRSFINYAALVLHLESGACPSGITIHDVNSRVKSLDQSSNYLTKPNLLIGYHDSEQQQGAYLATQSSYSPSHQAYCCYFCPQTFRSLQALNSHLKSPKHTLGPNKQYRCSPHLNGCQRDFTTLSALIMHMEGGSCGVRRFGDVMQNEGRRLGEAIGGGGMRIGW